MDIEKTYKQLKDIYEKIKDKTYNDYIEKLKYYYDIAYISNEYTTEQKKFAENKLKEEEKDYKKTKKLTNEAYEYLKNLLF